MQHGSWVGFVTEMTLFDSFLMSHRKMVILPPIRTAVTSLWMVVQLCGWLHSLSVLTSGEILGILPVPIHIIYLFTVTGLTAGGRSKVYISFI
jgi:hypothetical protein